MDILSEYPLIDSSGYHTPLFEVSYEADSVFRNGYENCPNLN